MDGVTNSQRTASAPLSAVLLLLQIIVHLDNFLAISENNNIVLADCSC